MVCHINVFVKHKSFHLERKNHGKCISAVIQMFLLSSGFAVDKMCVSHAKEVGIHILYFILIQID